MKMVSVTLVMSGGDSRATYRGTFPASNWYRDAVLAGIPLGALVTSQDFLALRRERTVAREVYLDSAVYTLPVPKATCWCPAHAEGVYRPPCRCRDVEGTMTLTPFTTPPKPRTGTVSTVLSMLAPKRTQPAVKYLPGGHIRYGVDRTASFWSSAPNGNVWAVTEDSRYVLLRMTGDGVAEYLGTLVQDMGNVKLVKEGVEHERRNQPTEHTHRGS